MQFEGYALKLNASAFASRSKAKAKPQRRDSGSSSTRTIPVGERTWADVGPGKYSLSDYPLSKKLIYLLRHGSLPRDDDGAIEFWRIKDHLQDHFLFCHHWSDEKWKSTMTGGVGQKKRFQYCSFRTQSYWSFITGQCHYSGRSLQVHSSCRMCNQYTLHHQFRIDFRRTKFEQQTDSILSSCESYG